MVRILILVIFAAIAFALAYFLMKSIPMKQKMLILGGAVAAAAIGVLMQNAFPLYMPLLAIVAVSLIATLIYMKQLEKTQNERKRQFEERRAARQNLQSRQRKSSLIKTEAEDLPNAVGMNTINRDREES